MKYSSTVNTWNSGLNKKVLAILASCWQSEQRFFFTVHDAANGFLSLFALSKHVFAPIGCLSFLERCVLPLFLPKKTVSMFSLCFCRQTILGPPPCCFMNCEAVDGSWRCHIWCDEFRRGWVGSRSMPVRVRARCGCETTSPMVKLQTKMFHFTKGDDALS